MKKIIIAIDGYSGCGKSTLARQLARRLHYTHIDTGAMYRAITLYFIRHDVNIENTEAVSAALKRISLHFGPNDSEGHADMFLNGENVEKQIREKEVAGRVSEVAALAEVREFAVDCQRELGKAKGVVMDGRDIGTTVFPDAELKLFMTADVRVRVERRYREILEKKEKMSLEEVRENLALRDYVDTHRSVSPLMQAADAIVIDNTDMSEEEQLHDALRLVKDITGKRDNQNL
jgi:cytidylate kinase